MNVKEAKIKDTFDWLTERGFLQTLDEVGLVTEDCPLYYLHVKNNDFVIVTHFNHKRRFDVQGFDLFYIEDLNPNTIGKEKNGNIKMSILSFNIDKHLSQLNEYLKDSTCRENAGNKHI